jgi:DNA helicase-2/ATP-dependent DNA helicase PcrA
VHQVQELIARQVAPGRIGIIYKENKYGQEISQYFKLLNIPVYTKRHLDILKLPFAQKLTLLLKYLASEHDIAFSGDEMLFEILHFDWFQIPALEIAKLSIENADKRSKGERTALRKLQGSFLGCNTSCTR